MLQHCREAFFSSYQVFLVRLGPSDALEIRGLLAACKTLETVSTAVLSRARDHQRAKRGDTRAAGTSEITPARASGSRRATAINTALGHLSKNQTTR